MMSLRSLFPNAMLYRKKLLMKSLCTELLILVSLQLPSIVIFVQGYIWMMVISNKDTAIYLSLSVENTMVDILCFQDMV